MELSTETPIEFSTSQKEALEKLTAWWNSDERNFILSGEPGTGKTFLTRYFTNGLRTCVPLFTAPTNEAVRQLQVALRGTKAVTRTTYSALGLKLSLFSKNQTIFQGKVPDDLYDFNLLVIDEASMASKKLDEKEKRMLMDYVDMAGLRTLWIGDWAQLPPVDGDKEHSPVFQEKEWSQTDLIEVQRHKGPILELATRFRKIIGSGAYVLNLPEIPEEIAVQKVSMDSPMVFTEEQYEALSKDQARIIVWTNAATQWNPAPGVLEYNNLVRNWVFGEELASQNPWLPGDRVLFTSPLFSVAKEKAIDLEKLKDVEFSMEASVNSRAEVISVVPETFHGIKCWKLLLSLEAGSDAVARTPTKEGYAAYKTLLEYFADNAKKADSGQGAGVWWEQYHLFQQLFGHMKHTYCITSHRSQGSSIPEVFVDLRNIMQNKKKRLTAFKAAYVAVTRAQFKLTLGMR